MQASIRIVLVNTSHPGNIGATARAMKTMGLCHLYLVAPKLFPHQKAIEMASGAQDILEKAMMVPMLDDAIADCHLVAGTSVRSRSIPWPLMTPRQFANYATQECSHTNIAIVFGREQSGLTNEELQRCHIHIQIPAHPNYNSLNVSAAVQIIAYELYANKESQPALQWDCPYATTKDMEDLYVHLERVLIQLQFLNPLVPRQLMTRLQRLFNRARLDTMEYNILRGILHAVEEKNRRTDKFV